MSRSGRIVVWLSVAVAFFLAGWIRQPIPGNNEPHYLAKAKHYWNPDWCRGDIFLESGNAHFVFVQTAGVLPQFVSLETTAWVGRIIASLLLAWGWCQLCWLLRGTVWFPLIAAGLFVLLTSFGSFSGEWVLGGVEGKVFSYAFVLLAAANAFEKRILLVGLFAGLAVAFHPLVGLWSVIAAGLPMLIALIRSPKQFGVVLKSKAIWFAGGVFVVVSAWGLLPALLLVGGGDAEAANRASLLQVFARLQHHLDPMAFPATAWMIAGIWLAVLIPISVLVWNNRRYRQVMQFLIGTLLIAIFGLAIGWGERPKLEGFDFESIQKEIPGAVWRAGLLKFYFFRIADGLLPAACAIAVSLALVRARDSISPAVFAVLGMVVGIINPGAYESPSRLGEAEYQSWRKACLWVKENTPSDALFLTPPMSFGFKYFAGRAEYATTKDCPQDADSLMKWLERLAAIEHWKADSRGGGYSRKEFAELREITGCRYFVAGFRAPLPIRELYSNRHYTVYELP